MRLFSKILILSVPLEFCPSVLSQEKQRFNWLCFLHYYLHPRDGKNLPAEFHTLIIIRTVFQYFPRTNLNCSTRILRMEEIQQTQHFLSFELNLCIT